jgi:hypothetical protein
MRYRAPKSFSALCLSALFSGVLAFSCIDSLAAKESTRLLTQDAYIGPQIFNSKRTRDNGVVQHGVMYGGTAGYDRLKRNAFYVGLWGSYAQGILRGKTSPNEEGVKSALRSRFREAEVEGRFGFTMQAKRGMRFFLTPFVGAGYFNELNHVLPPSPEDSLMKSRTSFGYASLGALSGIFVTHRLRIAIDFDAKFMVHGRCKSFDTEEELPEGKKSAITPIGEKIQYYTQLPITYQLTEDRHWLNFSFVPFLRYRHYGAHNAYFGKFYPTHFKNYGASLLLFCRF